MPGPDQRPSRLRALVAWYDRRRGGPTVLLVWLITRVVMLIALALFESFMVGDVYYYHDKLAALPQVGLTRTLNEYPTPVVAVLSLPYLVTGGSAGGYLVAFMVFMLLLDAGFTYALWRTGGRRHDVGVDFWLAFVFLVGPLSYLRFDLLPAVLAGGALLAARRRPILTGTLTGLGAAIKLWPALLIAAFAAHRPDRRRAVLGFAVTGIGLAVLSLLVGGWSRLISPLTWQSGRGLQIESIWATPLMVARAVRPDRWTVEYSRFQAYEIFGPGVTVWLTLSNLATVLGLAVLVLLWIRVYRSGAPSAVTIGILVLATVAIMTVTNKTLSPQYLLWLGGPGAALLLLRRRAASEERRTTHRLAVQLLVLAALTQLVYPLTYDALLGLRGRPALVAATVITAARNLALLVFTIEVCRLVWRPATPLTSPQLVRRSR